MTRKMKDSGVEWIGEIPESWEVRKFSDLTKIITDFVASGSFASLRENVQYLDFPNYAMLVRTVDLSKKMNKSRVYISKDSYDFLSNSNLKGGEIILPNIGSVGEVYLYEPLYERASLAPNAIMARMGELSLNKFYYYYFLSPAGRLSLLNIGDHAVQNKFNKTQLRQLKVVHPPISTQVKIVNVLNSKVTKIDSIISETQQSIDELKKYKQALITEIVTKGLDKNVEMKDSGIEWLGKVPSFWKIGRLKNLINQPLMYGANESGELFNPEWPRYIRITDIQENNLLSSENILSLEPTMASPYILKKGDVLFARSGATVGKAYYVDETSAGGAFAGYLIKASFNDDLVGKFIYYYTLSYSYQKWKESFAIQATIQNIGADKYSNMPLPIPDRTEMKILVEKASIIDRRLSKIIEEKKKMLRTMLDYKSSLIYEYVTGKKEV